MAVIFHTLTIGDVRSSDYGVYLTGEAVYDAPERAVEIVSVPGRNGDIIIDKGRYENIEVTYKAGMYGDDQEAFAAKIAAFRSAVLSQRGYVRISDDYNPDEYRMGVYVSGLEADVSHYSSAAEFDIVLNCKPQRFLTGGDTVQSFTATDTIENPTTETAYPLLNVKGVGPVQVGDRALTIQNKILGDFYIMGAQNYYQDGNVFTDLSSASAKMNAGDAITVGGMMGSFALASTKLVTSGGVAQYASISSITFSNITGPVTCTQSLNGRYAQIYATVTGDLVYTNLPEDDIEVECSANVTVKLSDNTTIAVILIMRITLQPPYGSNGERFMLYSYIYASDHRTDLSTSVSRFHVGEIRGTSTAYVVGENSYIDCESGDCYRIESGDAFSINDAVTFEGGELPRLLPGDNQISLGSGITEVEITPRWWHI